MATQMMVNRSSSMSTTSSHVENRTKKKPKPMKLEDAVQTMQSNLARYARSQDRRMVLRSLRDAKFLSNLSIDSVQQTEFEVSDLEEEVCQEKVILNGIPFKPVGRTAMGKSRGSNCTITMLKGLCNKLCERSEVMMDGNELYKQLVLRMAHSSGSMAPNAKLNSLLASSDLFVKPLTLDNIQAEKAAQIHQSVTLQKIAAQKAATDEQPIQLNVYEAHDELHVTLSETYKFGLFRKIDVVSKRAWIRIDAVVTERANMSTGESVRMLNLRLPELY